MIGIEVVDPDGRPDPELTARIVAAVHAQGVILLTCGSYGNVIRLLPPLSIPDDLLREGLAVLREAFRTV
jgi:4-aminobutyrate aminotransferase/(S)-3-amino-2-methylpropionate transaminase